MNEKAKDIPAGCYGMMCAFSDVMNYISWRHASPMFINFDFDPDKFNRYTFYRAIMENTAMVTYGHMQLVRESTGNIPKEVGLFPDISATAKKLVHIEHRFEPNMENHATYMKLYEDWRKMYARELQIADDRITRYMWAAPGV